MTREIAIVGDVHGDLDALTSIVGCAVGNADTIVFVGDYINRGPKSADVIDFLIELNRGKHSCVFLRGNHDAEFLLYLEGGAVAKFLALGGATTLKSYCSSDELPKLTDFRSLVPHQHLEFFKNLRPHYQNGRLLVTHSLADPVPINLDTAPKSVYRVAGHFPQSSRRPRVTDTYSLIDTGCGTWDDGALTCLFWPSGNWIQR